MSMFNKNSMMARIAMMFAAMSSETGKNNPSSTKVKEDKPLIDFRDIEEKKRLIAIRNGAKEFVFPDGFSCIARNEKNANRKHYNWLSKQ